MFHVLLSGLPNAVNVFPFDHCTHTNPNRALCFPFFLQFVRVPALSIKRCKQHFHSLVCGVDVILGNNGHVWIQATPTHSENTSGNTASPTPKESPIQKLTPAVRENIARVRNCIVVLAKMQIAIHKESLMDVYNESVELGLSAKDVLNPDMLSVVTRVALAKVEV